jgi:HPr kinase/phosphorylase
MEDKTTEVLGTQIPHITIPVRPGRDIARLVEVAAFQGKLKSTGYNAAEELNKRLIAQMNPDKPE